MKLIFFLLWSEKCIILAKCYGANADNHPKFEITARKLYVSVLTLSTQDMTLSTQNNEKLLQQLKTGFKRTINWNKYKSEPSVKTWNWYLDH